MRLHAGVMKLDNYCRTLKSMLTFIIVARNVHKAMFMQFRLLTAFSCMPLIYFLLFFGKFSELWVRKMQVFHICKKKKMKIKNHANLRLPFISCPHWFAKSLTHISSLAFMWAVRSFFVCVFASPIAYFSPDCVEICTKHLRNTTNNLQHVSI